MILQSSRVVLFGLAIASALVVPRTHGADSADVGPKAAKNPDWMRASKTKSLNMDSANDIAREARGKRAFAPSALRSTHEYDDGPYKALNVAFTDAAACQKFSFRGATVITRIGRFADMFVRADDKSATDVLNNDDSVIAYDTANPVLYPPIPHVVRVPQLTRAIPDSIATGGVGKYKGKGVIIAITDTGIDFRHPDFIAKDETSGKDVSRLMYFWDTTSELYKSGKLGSPSRYKFPNGEPIGTIFDRDELTANLNLRTAQPLISDWDSEGHGTACAGIAAGNGQGGPKDGRGNPAYIGVAPEATIIAVRTDNGKDVDNGFMFGAICQWLFEKAAGHPLVISCSWGDHQGGHDGSRVRDLEIDQLFKPETKGRVICCAAGNEGVEWFHGECQLHGKNQPGMLQWNSPGGNVLCVYFQTNNPQALDFDEERSTNIATLVDPSTGKTYYNCQLRINPLTNQPVMQVQVEDGKGSLALYTRDGTAVSADAYFGENDGAKFDEACRSNYHMIVSPATAANAIAVGSYDWNDRFNEWGEIRSLPPVWISGEMRVGELSLYSSPGYRRLDGAVKPEIAAPGQWHAAPASLNVPAEHDTTGLYRTFNGTSAATPYTAGVVALLLEKYPSLTVGEIKSRLEKAASPPRKGLAEHASPLPNPYWGYGKLDRAAVERLLAN
jgi:subtilisin family serine protease